MTLTQKRAQASFRMRLLVHLANRRQRKATDAFTLVELMIVVAVIGLLSAVALPQYLQARNAAAAGARIGEIVGQAKECSTAVVSGIGNPGGVCGSAGGTYTASWGADVSGLRCLNVTNGSGDAASVGVSSSGGLTCSIG